jgi:hypothetical protein
VVTSVVVKLIVIVVAGVVVVDVKETVLDVDRTAVDVADTVSVVVPISEEVAAELDVPELGMEDEDEMLDVGEVDDEAVRVPLVAVVVRLSLEAASGKNAPRPRARTKTTTTATVAPAAICLLYSDNRGPLLSTVDIVLCFRMVSSIGAPSESCASTSGESVNE